MPPALRLTVGEVADLTGGEITGDDRLELAGIAPLDRAGPSDLSFLAHGRFHTSFLSTQAGAVLVKSSLKHLKGGPPTRVAVADPYRALMTLLERWYPASTVSWGVDPTARIGRACRWSGRIALGPGVVLGANVVIGRDCAIGGQTVIGTDVRIGDRCQIGAHVTIGDGCVLGNDVVIGPGAKLANAGFRFLDAERGRVALPHMGQCVIQDGVAIGANTTVDRGSFGDTVVGAGTKIDNLVQIAHNCRIGTACIIMAQVGIAGSTVVEDDVVLAGQAGLADHLVVRRGARVAAQAGVIGDIPTGATVSGYPARDHRTVLRQAAALGRLTPLTARLERLVADRESRR